MKKNKLLRWCLLCVGVIILVVLVVNIQNIRDIVARQFGTISVINATQRTEEVLKENYPKDQFQFASGSYVDEEGVGDDASYTANYIVNDQEDNVISVVYSDKDYENIWQGNVQIFIQKKAYERKCSLVARLAKDYTELVNKELGEELDSYILNDSDLAVRSFYQDPDYDKPLPDDLEFGMRFQKDLDLDFEFRLMVQACNEGMEEETSKNIIKTLNEKEFTFVQYNFMFVSGKDLVHYIYDENGNLLEVETERI